MISGSDNVGIDWSGSRGVYGSSQSTLNIGQI